MENTKELTVVKQNDFDYNGKIALMTAEEKQQSLALASKLDYHDLCSIQQYGSDLTKIIANNGNALLNSVKSDSSVEVIGYVNEILTELNGFDESINMYTGQHSNALKRFFYSLPFVKKVATSLDKVLQGYNTVAENVDKITEKISNAKVVALRDNSTLNEIMESNKAYIEQIQNLIVAAKLKSNEMKDHMAANKLTIDPFELNSMENFVHKIDNRIADLQTTEYVLTQNLYQIAATQNNNLAIAEKTDNIVNHVIPIWKNQLPMAIIMKNQKASIDAQAKISETTNKLIQKTATDLRINSIEVAKASEERVISIDTLKNSTQELITTMKEVNKIHADGEKNQAQLEAALKDFAKQINDAIGK